LPEVQEEQSKQASVRARTNNKVFPWGSALVYVYHSKITFLKKAPNIRAQRKELLHKIVLI